MTTEQRVLLAIGAHDADHGLWPTGYAIARLVPQRFLFWTLPLAIGTTYATLYHLAEKGLVAQYAGPEMPRHRYGLTAAGQAEAARLRAMDSSAARIERREG